MNFKPLACLLLMTVLGVFLEPSVAAQQPDFIATFSGADGFELTADYNVDDEDIKVSLKRSKTHPSMAFLAKAVAQAQYKVTKEPRKQQNQFTSPGTIKISLKKDPKPGDWYFFANGIANYVVGEDKYTLVSMSFGPEFFLDLLEVCDVKSAEEKRIVRKVTPGDPFAQPPK